MWLALMFGTAAAMATEGLLGPLPGLPIAVAVCDAASEADFLRGSLQWDDLALDTSGPLALAVEIGDDGAGWLTLAAT
jgi:hypothetical protein